MCSKYELVHYRTSLSKWRTNPKYCYRPRRRTNKTRHGSYVFETWTMEHALAIAWRILHLVMAQGSLQIRKSMWPTFLKWIRRESNIEPFNLESNAWQLHHGSYVFEIGIIEHALAIARRILHIVMAQGGQRIRPSLSSTFLMNPTWIEHATFWSGDRRTTIAPRILRAEKIN